METQKIEDSVEFLTSVEEEHTKCTGLHLGIFDVCSSVDQQYKLLGSVAIRKINMSSRSGEVGCWLSSDSQGKGLATKACLKIIEYGKTAIGVEQFELHAAVDNHRTQALAERLHFKRVPGVIGAAELIDSKPVDHVVYVLDTVGD